MSRNSIKFWQLIYIWLYLTKSQFFFSIFFFCYFFKGLPNSVFHLELELLVVSKRFAIFIYDLWTYASKVTNCFSLFQPWAMDENWQQILHTSKSFKTYILLCTLTLRLFLILFIHYLVFSGLYEEKLVLWLCVIYWINL